MIFQINENCVEFKAPMKRKLCLKVPELISIKKEIYASFYSFYDNIEHVEERRTTLPQEHYCNQTITAFLIAL